MTVLIILALLGVVIVYAVFFLLFKLLWMILKKNSNKWPLILSGICTIVFGIVLGALAGWGVYKVVSPFRGMMARLDDNPAPVYGERVYTDPIYRFELDVFNGIDFSEWMDFDDLDVKIGVDMNAFKKNQTDAEEDQNERQFVGAVILRQEDADEGHPLQPLREALASTDHRQDLEVLSQEDFLMDGYPAMFVTGRVYARNGKRLFVALNAMSDEYRQVFYVIALSADLPESAETAIQTARSLRLENGLALPSQEDAQALLSAEEQPADTTDAQPAAN